MIIQLMGLPGSGKTTISDALTDRINGIHLNADEVRKTINNDLGFSHEDRIEHARRMGELARMLARKQSQPVVVDFVCPTPETRAAFGKADIVVWMDTIKAGRFDDTNKLWTDPEYYDHRIEDTGDEYLDAIPTRAFGIITKFKLFDWKADTVLMLGRYQPWHPGHRALYDEAKKRADQVVVGVRHTSGMTDKDPLHFWQVKEYIESDVESPIVVKMPNFKHIVYGRDVGYNVEKIELGEAIEAISATDIRKEMGI
tara:strand:+ start:11005 stop:11772 length:768 start_codon:yes stop_codon:yes gene_type:complete